VKASKVQRVTKARLKSQNARALETVSSQDNGTKSATVANAPVIAQVSSTSREVELPVTKDVPQGMAIVDTASQSEKMGCSQCSLAYIATQVVA
jgi:hypothetical protein